MRAHKSSALIGLLCAAGAIALEAQSSDLNYPQWRGTYRDGAASGFVAPRAWPAALTRRWKVEVGEGYATPLVIGDMVYTFTRRDDREVLSALDARSGRERWQSSYPAPYSPARPAAAHGAGPKATPLFHEGKLFTQGISGIVSAFDARTGKRLWQTASPAEAPFYGAASSPLGERGLVITHPGNYGPLTAFDEATGAIKWTAGSGGFFASPILVHVDRTPQVVSVTQDSVIGVSLDGQILWQHSWKGGNGSITPVFADGIIIVGSPDGVAGFRPARRDDTWTVEQIWETKDVTIYVSSPVAVDGVLYGLSTKQKGQHFAIDVKTGQVLWLGEPREADNTAFVTGGRVLFLLNDDAELIVAKASRQGFEAIVRYAVADSATWAQPTISGNRIFIKDVRSVALWTID